MEDIQVLVGAGNEIASVSSSDMCKLCAMIIEGYETHEWHSAALVIMNGQSTFQVLTVGEPGAERMFHVQGGEFVQAHNYSYAVQMLSVFKQHIESTTCDTILIRFVSNGVELRDCFIWPQDDTHPVLLWPRPKLEGS